MTVLLPMDDVTLYPPGGQDGHGWREMGFEPYWTGRGNMQFQTGVSDPRAGDGGGHGPFQPAHDLIGTLFLPEDGQPLEGGWAQINGRAFALSMTRHMPDPAGGGAGCWQATATSVDTWPGALFEQEHAL